MKKLLLPFIISGLLLACNNNQSTSQTENKSEIKTEPQVLKEVTPIQDDNKTETTAKTDCNAISQALKTISNENTIDDIEKIENELKECLPTVDNATQLQWANDYHQAYENFLTLWRLDGDKPLLDDIDDEAFYNTMTALSDNQTPNPKELAILPKRVQYLAKLSQDNKIKVQYLCEGEFEFAQKYQNYLDIFVPHLSKDQIIFTKQLVKENDKIFWCDASIAIPLRELIERTLFWQDFPKEYPNSQLTKSAESNYQDYAYYLFFGAENTQWLEYDKTAFINHTEEGDNKTIEQHFIDLAKHESPLGEKAKAYLEFVATPIDERPEKYPLDESLLTDKETGEPISEWELATLQLQKALNLTQPNYNEQCADMVFCTNSMQD